MSVTALDKIQLIGHGLAGAILAETLSEAGFRIQVTDDGGPASSRVAAGLYTPLTGRRMIPSWELDQALPRVRQFYPDLEKTLGLSFHHTLDTVRIFKDEDQRNEARNRAPKEFLRFCDVSHVPFHSPFGGAMVSGGGWVDLPIMLDGLTQRRKQKQEWGTWENPDLILWCQGAAAATDPLWKECGWRNAHGDVLTLEIDDLSEDHIYSFGKFLLPIGNGHFRCGATYKWNQPGPEPREEGKEELVSELRKSLKLNFRISEHRAGIRPVALARVPIAGPHPDHPEQWIFNGFGSKGVLYAPWMAERVRDLLLKGTPLPKETIAARRIQRQRDREQSWRGSSRTA